MSGANFSRVKDWTTEILTNTDLNAEIDNILNHLDPTGVGDYSDTATMMKLTTSPGATGSESLATSLAGEIERLRFVIKRIIGAGATNWYDAPSTDITNIVASLGGSGLPANRILSGATSPNSSQMLALIPSGSTASVVLSAATTPFVYAIAGVQYSITANITLTGLSLAAGTNNTASINETAGGNQQWTKFAGQYGTRIQMSAAQSGFSGAVGTIVGLKKGAEYFIATINSTAELSNAWRGAFFNSTPSAIPATTFTNGDNLTLMKLAWIFATNTSALAVSYNNPVVSATQPTSPNTGDYWYDLGTSAWKTFNSTTWVQANAALIGLTMQDTAACVAARTFDSYVASNSYNTMQFETCSNTVIQAANMFSEVNIFGNTIRFGESRPTWDITANLDSGLGLTASKQHFLYMKQTGVTVVSDKPPMARKDLGGLYYPTETWRCFGSGYLDGSTHWVVPIRTFRDIGNGSILMGDWLSYNANNNTQDGFVAWPFVPDVYPNRFVQTGNANGGSQTIAITAQQTFTIDTFSLSHGVWAINAAININTTGTPASSFWNAGVSTWAGGQVSIPDGYLGFNVNTGYLPNVSGAASCIVIPRFLVAINAGTSQSWYLSAYFRAIGGGATYSVAGWRVLAERIDDLSGTPL